MNLEAEIEKLKGKLQEYERRTEEAERLAQKAEQRIRPTMLAEYIRAFHDLVFVKFKVKPDANLRSKGSVTNPRNKICPPRLEAWSNFFE